MSPDRVARLFPDHFTVLDDGCWAWTRGKIKSGYGAVVIAGRLWPAHRAFYEIYVGPVPEGLDLDHLCRVRHCVNPAHLEAVTRRVNLLRGDTLAAFNAEKTHCPQGHPYDAQNTKVYKNRRYCRTCQRDRNAARKPVKDVA